MSTRQFNWKETAQLIGGIAFVALIQAGLLLPERPDFIGSWIIMAIFGTVYAVVGGVTSTRLLEKKRERQRMEGRESAGESDTDA
jgi:phosphate/sulfate permease